MFNDCYLATHCFEIRSCLSLANCFHYLIIYDKLDILKLTRFPIYQENEDGLNGLCLASKYSNIPILRYLINTYPEYIYNRNSNNELFTDYLEYKCIFKILDLN